MDAFHVASNIVFHGRIKHRLIVTLLEKKVLAGETTTGFVISNDQLANMSAKSLIAGLKLNIFVTSLVYIFSNLRGEY